MEIVSPRYFLTPARTKLASTCGWEISTRRAKVRSTILIMVASKRKSPRESEQILGSPTKKIKNGDRHELVRREKKRSKFSEEAETDSDPIIESETGSESGEDDGASWPSDEEQEDFGGFDENIDNDAGAMDIAAEASNAVGSSQKDTHKPGRSLL